MFVKNATVVSATSFGFMSLANCLPRGFPGGGIVYTLKSNYYSNYCLICDACCRWAYWLLNVCLVGYYWLVTVGLPYMLWVGVLLPWITDGGCICDFGFYWTYSTTFFWGIGDWRWTLEGCWYNCWVGWVAAPLFLNPKLSNTF